MNKEMLDILNDLSKKPTTGLALQIMELSSENLILEQQTKEQQEVIDKATNILKKGLNELDTRKREEVYIEEYIENALDILKEVSE